MRLSKIPTFKYMTDKYGDNLYTGTNVDNLTKTALKQYFDFLNISDPVQDKWIWMFKRQLNLYYPVYKNELDMWADYRTNEWFYDKQKINNKTHTETTTLTEDLKRQLSRNLEKTFKEIWEGNNTANGTGDLSINGNNNNTENSDTKGTINTESKDREFAFNYPESNYTAKVIPYDLNNNPVVEFIDKQADKVGRNNQTNQTTNETTNEGTHSETQESSFSNKGTDNHTNNQTGNDNEKQNEESDKKQTITNKYTDNYDYDGSNIIDLASKMIELIQSANFFKEFVNHLEKCFNHMYTEDDLDMEDFEYAEFI